MCKYTGGDVEVASSNASYTLGMNDSSVTVAAITIINDESPEDMEQFTLSLAKGEGSDTLNIFLRVTVATLSIIDDDGR